MWKILVIFLLVVPSIVSAKTYFTPSGVAVKADMPVWTLEEKTWTLLNGRIWKEFVLIPKARAKELNLTLKEQIIAYVGYWAGVYGLNAKDIDKLIVCESNYDTDILGDKGQALGLFQWWDKSWNYYNKKFKTNLDRNNWRHQVEMSSHVLATENGWKNWLWCYQNAVLGIKWPK